MVAITKAARLARDNQALELYLAGATMPQIAQALGYSAVASAYRTVERALMQQVVPATEEVRRAELMRLDGMLRKLQGKINGGDIKAIETALKIMDRRAKYLGLDAPTKAEVTHFSATGHYEQEIAQIVEAMRTGKINRVQRPALPAGEEDEAVDAEIVEDAVVVGG